MKESTLTRPIALYKYGLDGMKDSLSYKNLKRQFYLKALPNVNKRKIFTKALDFPNFGFKNLFIFLSNLNRDVEAFPSSA